MVLLWTLEVLEALLICNPLDLMADLDLGPEISMARDSVNSTLFVQALG